jgi:hypothetical protein
MPVAYEYVPVTDGYAGTDMRIGTGIVGRAYWGAFIGACSGTGVCCRPPVKWVQT